MCVCLCAQGPWPSSMSQPAPDTRTHGAQVTTSPKPQDTESPCLSLKGPAPCPGKPNPSGSPGVTLIPIPATSSKKLCFSSLALSGSSILPWIPPSPRWFIYEMTHRLLMFPKRIRWKQHCHLPAPAEEGTAQAPSSPKSRENAASSQSVLHCQTKTAQKGEVGW